jgi:aspartate/methionine/tyrosine aminotransferase
LIKEYGAVPVPLPLLEREGYCFDIDYFESKVNERTRLLILNSPQNPTGGVLNKDTLLEISEVVKKFDNLWVFSDEPYCRTVHDEEFSSIASIPGIQERTIIVDGVSKTYAMTGWRIGYASNIKLAPHLSRWITNTDSCAAHPNQYAAIAALTGPQEESYEMMRSYTKRRDIIVGGLNRIPGINCLKPGGAFYAWPNVTDACKLIGVSDSEEFRKRLLHEAGVAGLSDIHFGHRNPGEGEHIRLSYATSEENIQGGLKRIRYFIEENTI